jgi:hypothetical protein
VTSAEDREIFEVQGRHQSGKSNDDVLEFYIEHSDISFMPRGITKFFNNLTAVTVYDTNLKEITKDDLKEFGNKLNILWLVRNNIEVIESDLFEFNKNLTELDLSNNKIRHIGENAFVGLEEIKTFRFYSNACQSQPVAKPFEVEKMCKDSNYVGSERNFFL